MTHAHTESVDSEMHDLNAEADLLEQKTTVVHGGANGQDTRLQSHSSDPDAQAMVIDSLRTQVQDLFSQVSQLNNKLVRSYDRVSDLEDEIHVTSSNLRQATIKVSQLELERTQHLSALSTGLLVEKSHVTSELTRLMEKATEEAARRGQAESARAEIEKDLDDLSAGLFDQANRMVAEARIAEARSSRKLEETEGALRSAEEVVGALQAQMQALEAEKEQTDRRMEVMRIRMGKGKWVERTSETTSPGRPRLLATHLPYYEFLNFVSHLRTIRPASVQPPAMSTLLTLPFLARLLAEDSDPTVRLDLAPSLNWLSRRSVLAAIHNGQLTVEPMQFTALLEELAPPNIPANSHHTHVVCALCGMPIYSSSDSPASTPTTPVPTPRSGAQSASWSTALFKNVRSGDITIPFSTHNRHSAQFGTAITEPPSTVYIFRLEATSSGLPVSLPLSSQQPGTPARQAIYPLCCTGWCLSRLRATCSLWAFVRTSVVEKIWEEPPMTTLTNGVSKPGVNGVERKHDGPNGVVSNDRTLAPIQPPPRRSKMGLGSLWGSMQRSLSGSREPDTKVAEPVRPKDDARPKLPPRDPSRKTLPPPPPAHPNVAHAKNESVSGTVHRVPPPFRESSPAPVQAPPTSSTPPPLPKRNRERETRSATPEVDQKPQANGVVNGSTESDAPADQPNEPEAAHVDVAPPTDAPVEAEASAPSQTEGTESPKAESDAPKSELPKPELTIPPSISRATSNESFATPTEELAPSVEQSPAVVEVSLPASEEPLPAPQEKTPTSEHPPVIDASPIIAPTDTPAPVLPADAAAVKDQDDNTPTRTGSPAPPPLPRRAAARARSSVPAPQAQESGPAKEDAPAPADAVAPTAAPADEKAATEASVPSAPEQLQEPKVDADTSASVPDAPVVPSEVAALPEVPALVTEEPEPMPVVVAESAADTPTVPEAPVNGVAPEDDAPPADAIATSKEVHLDTAPTAPEKAIADEVDNGQFVGDASWEDRTYKELVRLREEMFWARVGASVH